ncbi:MAG: bifunctional nicotinamidase/pyrazinamidase [Bacteroidota bacterium]|nr:bifunctional nicotinamidase/pyrazinamidase [Bacteroidota bacterium]
MTALLIIDVQNDFLDGGSLEVRGSKSILPKINALQSKFDLVVATQDWHPIEHESFAVNHQKELFEVIDLHGIQQVLWPVHCVQGTYGAELHKELLQNRIEVVFRKGMDKEVDSYSAFYDNGKRKSTGLSEYLKVRGITQVYLCGVAADYCVYYSAVDAVEEGFEVFFIEDATKEISSENYQDAKNQMLDMGIQFVSSNHI